MVENSCHYSHPFTRRCDYRRCTIINVFSSLIYQKSSRGRSKRTFKEKNYLAPSQEQIPGLRSFAERRTCECELQSKATATAIWETHLTVKRKLKSCRCVYLKITQLTKTPALHNCLWKLNYFVANIHVGCSTIRQDICAHEAKRKKSYPYWKATRQNGISAACKIKPQKQLWNF